jgi:hypothetical protein
MDEQNNPIVTEKNGSTGPIVGVIIILAVIVLGGLYFWNQRANVAPEVVETEEMVESMNTEEESDELSSEVEAGLETELDVTL